MSGINKVMLVGHIQDVPEIINPNLKNAFTKFHLQTAETINKVDGRFTIVELHIILVTSKFAETAFRYLKKGDYIFIEGKVRTRMSVDSNSNKKKYVAEIYADSYTLLIKALNVSRV